MARILLLSDIHAAVNAAAEGTSHVQVDPDTANPRHDALLAIRDVLPDSIDYVFVAGDLCNKADGTALRYAWGAVQGLATDLNAELFAVPGNHDLDSRFGSSPDPRGLLLSLDRPFPSGVDSDDNHFWARNYLVSNCDEFILIQLNTAALHGYQEEAEHGRVSRFTLDRLESDLRRLRESEAALTHKPCILLCHHHPYPHPDLRDEDGSDPSAMYGSHLLQNLIEQDHKSWMILHGHRHYPQVFYAPGGANSATVLSLGATGAALTGIDTGVLNSVHVLDFGTDPVTNAVQGELWTWTFARGIGWTPSTGTMSHRTGFGERQAPGHFVAEIVGHLTLRDGDLSGTDLHELVPRILFLMPAELRSLVTALEDAGATVAFDEQNCRIDRIVASEAGTP